MTKHDLIIADNLKPCPLCGTPVRMKVEGKIVLNVPGEDLPMYWTRMLIKCEHDYLTLDLADCGYVDAEGRPEEENRTLLEVLMRRGADKVRETWNRRTSC